MEDGARMQDQDRLGPAAARAEAARKRRAARRARERGEHTAHERVDELAGYLSDPQEEWDRHATLHAEELRTHYFRTHTTKRTVSPPSAWAL